MDLLDMVKMAFSLKASDLNLVVGSRPLVRINGDIGELADTTELSAADVSQALISLTSPEMRQAFEAEMELDFGYTLSGVGRLRCNAAQQLNGISLAVRLLPPKVPTIDELGLPQIYKEFIREPRGLIILSGPTGSGKSTSLAAMVNEMNLKGGRHIITIEDPIEYIHTNIKSAITQRELGKHTLSYSSAIKHALRQNPDVILVGEVRDSETAAAVLTAAEAGHLVMTTSQAPSAPQAVERLVDMFPFVERGLSETRLASLLVAIACQTLVPRADRHGRIAAIEILVANPAVKALIRDGKIHQLPNAIRTNHHAGMISLRESLEDMYRREVITKETMEAFCSECRDHYGQ